MGRKSQKFDASCAIAGNILISCLGQLMRSCPRVSTVKKANPVVEKTAGSRDDGVFEQVFELSTAACQSQAITSAHAHADHLDTLPCLRR
ncbi:hypothetical protein RRG08_043373 [Elysia crispata]|uniref:Uncharacterized protein n=1 Tax=Elysia crispata TaxID=231223 RepID=A0AAE0Z6D9_9GAST|nr:hypothetical protein RRG08_043373 [Elysia crispata]